MKRVTKFYIATLSLMLGILIFGDAVAQSVGRVFSGPVYFKNANLKVDANTVGSLTKAQMLNRTRTIELPVQQFVLAADGVTPTTGDPARVIVSSATVLEWAQGESGKAQTSFVVPADYVSGATFSCLVKLDAASADSTLDFEIYVEADAAAPDAATTNQTPVAIANSTTNSQLIALPVATDTVAAGNIVVFNVWRGAGTGASSDVNLFGCYFTYTADM
jgi:hypothetical protein